MSQLSEQPESKKNIFFNPIVAGIFIFFLGLAPLGLYAKAKMDAANLNSFTHGNGAEYTPLIRSVTGASLSFAPIIVFAIVAFANSQKKKGGIDKSKGIISLLLGITIVFIVGLISFYNRPEYNIDLHASELIIIIFLPALIGFPASGFFLALSAAKSAWGKAGLVLNGLILSAWAYYIVTLMMTIMSDSA